MAGMLSNMSNLANVKLTANLTSSANTVTVDDASVFLSLGSFYATIMPSDDMSRLSNSEIVKCSYNNATTLTIERAQRGTTAKSFNAGAILTNGIYVEDLAQVQSVGNTVFSTTYSAGVYTISSDNDKLPSSPTTGMRITVKFGANNSGAASSLKLQSTGASAPIVTGAVINGGSKSVGITPILYSNEIHELVYDGTNWVVEDILSGSGATGLIDTDNIENGAIDSDKIGNNEVTKAKLSTTFTDSLAYLSGNTVNPTSNVYVYTDNIDSGAVVNSKIANNTIAYGKINWSTISWSSTEKIVGYFNSKPIYRRIITGTSPSGSSWTEVLSFGFNIDWVVGFSWSMKADGDEYIFPMTMSSSDHAIAVEWYLSGLSSLKMKCNNAYSRSKSFCAMIDYTKA